jgi:hypothetical protein
MTADNNSTEDKPDPTPFKVYPMTNARSKRMRGGPAREFASKDQAMALGDLGQCGRCRAVDSNIHTVLLVCG